MTRSSPEQRYDLSGDLGTQLSRLELDFEKMRGRMSGLMHPLNRHGNAIGKLCTQRTGLALHCPKFDLLHHGRAQAVWYNGLYCLRNVLGSLQNVPVAPKLASEKLEAVLAEEGTFWRPPRTFWRPPRTFLKLHKYRRVRTMCGERNYSSATERSQKCFHNEYRNVSTYL
jgi:hypothetical protein